MRDMVGQVTAILGIIEIQSGNSVTGVKFCREAVKLAKVVTKPRIRD